jgi:hypothetical protein
VRSTGPATVAAETTTAATDATEETRG